MAAIALFALAPWLGKSGLPVFRQLYELYPAGFAEAILPFSAVCAVAVAAIARTICRTERIAFEPIRALQLCALLGVLTTIAIVVSYSQFVVAVSYQGSYTARFVVSETRLHACGCEATLSDAECISELSFDPAALSSCWSRQSVALRQAALTTLYILLLGCAGAAAGIASAMESPSGPLAPLSALTSALSVASTTPAGVSHRHAASWWHSHADPNFAVVFVHGIFSDSDSCWRYVSENGDVYWPDLAASDPRLQQPSIFMCGYYTALDSAEFALDQCATWVLDALQRPSVDGHRPPLDFKRIAFVCHSTGGIVVRYLLERNRELFKPKTIGLALLASPSLGSRWANVASLAARYYNQRLGMQLRWRGESIRDIHGRFQTLLNERTLPGLFGMEAAEHHMIMRDRLPRFVSRLLPARLTVVPTVSAGVYFGQVRIIAETNHFTIAKPTGLDHPSHAFLVTFLLQFSKWAEARSFASGDGA